MDSARCCWEPPWRWRGSWASTDPSLGPRTSPRAERAQRWPWCGSRPDVSVCCLSLGSEAIVCRSPARGVSSTSALSRWTWPSVSSSPWSACCRWWCRSCSTRWAWSRCWGCAVDRTDVSGDEITRWRWWCSSFWSWSSPPSAGAPYWYVLVCYLQTLNSVQTRTKCNGTSKHIRKDIFSMLFDFQFCPHQSRRRNASSYNRYKNDINNVFFYIKISCRFRCRHCVMWWKFSCLLRLFYNVNSLSEFVRNYSYKNVRMLVISSHAHKPSHL